jgi:septum site-determining protein MinC
MEKKPLSDTVEVGNCFLPNQYAPAIELKGSVFTLTVLRLQSTELEAIERELAERLSLGPRFFENAPVVLDLEPIKGRAQDLDLPGLIKLMRNLRLIPVGVRHSTPDQQALAIEAGIAVMKGGIIQDLPNISNPRKQVATKEKEVVTNNEAVTNKDGARERLGNGMNATSTKTKIVHQPVRSGQQIYVPDGDLILLAAVSAGAEVIASGNIHIYAPLRGRALAGVKGETNVRIFCQCMEAELVAVAGQYQIFEEPIPDKLYHKAVQIYLDGDRLTIVPLLASPHPKMRRG